MSATKRAIRKKLGLVKDKPVRKIRGLRTGLGESITASNRSRTAGGQYQGTLKSEVSRRKRDRAAQQSS